MSHRRSNAPTQPPARRTDWKVTAVQAEEVTPGMGYLRSLEENDIMQKLVDDFKKYPNVKVVREAKPDDLKVSTSLALSGTRSGYCYG